MSRILDGLYSICLSLRKLPIVRYLSSSRASKVLAEKLVYKLKQEFSSANVSEPSRMVLVIGDRREDPVTPLLN